MNDHAILRLALPGVALCSGGLALLASPATAQHTPDHTAPLYALEVSAPEGAPVTEAACGQPVAIPGMADAADLPAGTTAAVVLEGPLQAVTGDAACRTWWIGGYPVAAPFSGEPTLPAGSVIRVVGAAEVAPSTTIVAERMVDREETGVGSVELELAYHAEFTIVNGDLVVDVPAAGDCLTLPDNTWTVQAQGDDRQWQLDVSSARGSGEVEPCFQPGDAVAAEFDLAPPEREGGDGLLGGLLGQTLPGVPLFPAGGGTGGLLPGTTGGLPGVGDATAGAPDVAGLTGSLPGVGDATAGAPDVTGLTGDLTGGLPAVGASTAGLPLVGDVPELPDLPDVPVVDDVTEGLLPMTPEEPEEEGPAGEEEEPAGEEPAGEEPAEPEEG